MSLEDRLVDQEDGVGRYKAPKQSFPLHSPGWVDRLNRVRETRANQVMSSKREKHPSMVQCRSGSNISPQIGYSSQKSCNVARTEFCSVVPRGRDTGSRHWHKRRHGTNATGWKPCHVGK